VPALALLFGLAAGGCSMSFPLSSIFGGDDSPKSGEVTGSLALQPVGHSVAQPAMSQTDWTLARNALREALNRNEDGASIPWENPMTRARGTVTPIAAAYEKDGFPCRNFIASHMREGRETWFEGTACRIHRGDWDIQSSRPLQKS
jgi:surface antigen